MVSYLNCNTLALYWYDLSFKFINIKWYSNKLNNVIEKFMTSNC